jgi:hypothetical protein
MRKTLAVACVLAAAGRTGTLTEFPDQPITTGSGKPPTPAQVREAIVAAATPLGWTVQDAGPQLVTATLVVRNKHTIVVDVSYGPSAYSVTYKSSVNMNYEVQGTDRFIHPNYNKWTKNLVDAIRNETAKL